MLSAAISFAARNGWCLDHVLWHCLAGCQGGENALADIHSIARGILAGRFSVLDFPRDSALLQVSLWFECHLRWTPRLSTILSSALLQMAECAVAPHLMMASVITPESTQKIQDTWGVCSVTGKTLAIKRLAAGPSQRMTPIARPRTSRPARSMPPPARTARPASGHAGRPDQTC